MTQLVDDARVLWSKFRGSMCDQLERTPTGRFRKAWSSQTERTVFYMQQLLPRIADNLKLEAKPELFTVDMAMGLPSPIGILPLVWIESENDVLSITHEVRKLASLAGPLKVLLTCCEWDDTPGAWRHGGMKRQCLEDWAAIQRAHGQAWPSASIFAIVVGEWNANLRFYATAFDGTGDTIDHHSVIFDRLVPSIDDLFILDVTDQGPLDKAEMARRCDTNEHRVQSIVDWIQTSRDGKRQYNIEVDGDKITVRSKGDWRREVLERFGRS